VIWADEFDGPAGSLPDPTKWAYDLGRGQNGWGNNELEEYTNSPENVFLDGQGQLVIRAVKDVTGNYTSARLKTQGLFEVGHGRIEARMKLPYGQGIWPAFWMLGADVTAVGWPRCGEIDIMENIGKEPSIVHATVHGPGYSGGQAIGAPVELPTGERLSDDFHEFAVEWTENRLEFFLDGKSYHKVTPASLPTGASWVFGHPFFLLMNLAVGGNWPGYPNSTTVFPQSLVIDWLRVTRILER
jgi:beta-glucanase (GH16 family)